MSRYNVMGDAVTVLQLIETLKMRIGMSDRVVTEVYPAEPDKRDLEVEVPVSLEDDFTEWCEDAGVVCNLV